MPVVEWSAPSLKLRNNREQDIETCHTSWHSKSWMPAWCVFTAKVCRPTTAKRFWRLYHHCDIMLGRRPLLAFGLRNERSICRTIWQYGIDMPSDSLKPLMPDGLFRGPAIRFIADLDIKVIKRLDWEAAMLRQRTNRPHRSCRAREKHCQTQRDSIPTPDHRSYAIL